MPEFELDLGSHKGVEEFRKLDSFTQGYIEAAFFCEANADNPELEHATFEQLAGSALASAIADCVQFQEANAGDLAEAIDNGRIHGYDETRAGHDFWYTRNHHGVGYWDRDLDDAGDKLTKAAHECGDVDMYRGDDGLIYFS